MFNLKIPSSTWVGALVPGEELRDLYQIVFHAPHPHPKGTRPSLSCTILSAFPRSPNCNCSCLLFGTQERPKGLRSFSYKQEVGSLSGLLYLGRFPQGPAQFQSPPLCFDTSQSWGKQRWDKKRKKVLGGEVNYQLHRGTQF